MKKSKFSLTQYKDKRTVELMKKTNHKTLAVWAIDCAECVLPYFKKDWLRIVNNVRTKIMEAKEVYVLDLAYLDGRFQDLVLYNSSK